MPTTLKIEAGTRRRRTRPKTASSAAGMLFRIDPVPHDAQVKAIEAQLKLSSTRRAQMTQLFERDSGRGSTSSIQRGSAQGAARGRAVES